MQTEYNLYSIDRQAQYQLCATFATAQAARQHAIACTRQWGSRVMPTAGWYIVPMYNVTHMA